MHLEVSAKGLDLQIEVRRHAELHIRFALGRFADRVEHVDLRLVGENESTTSIAFTCRIRVRLVGLETVLVEQRGIDVLTVIDATANRAGRTVARRLAGPAKPQGRNSK